MATQPRAAETRRKLIDAGVDLFVEKGYVDTTPKDIAYAADLTTGAFYYHFKSKEELAAAIIDEGWPNASKVLHDFLGSPGAGLPKIIALTFAMLDTVNLNRLQWIGFHINQALGHLSPSARNDYFERVQAFFTLVAGSIERSELREDVTAAEAAELIWMTMNGAQLLSDAVGDRGPALFSRLTTAWRATLRAIATQEALPALLQDLDEIASRYEMPRVRLAAV